MKEKMKQNKKILAIFFVSVITILNLITPAFAYTDNSSNNIDFTDQPLPTGNYNMSTAEIRENGLLICTVSSWASQPTSAVSLINSDVYAFAYTSSNNKYVCYAWDLDSGITSGYIVKYTMIGNDSNSTLQYRASDNTNNLAYTFTSSSNSGTFSVPVFDTLEDGLAAVRDWIDNPTSASTPHSLSISLPAGNILVAEIFGIQNNSFYIETTGGTTGATVKPGMNNIQVGYHDSLPSSFTAPNSSYSYITFYGTGSKSIFGTYNRQYSTSAIDSTRHYLVITNPMYPNDNNASANRLNPDLTIQIDQVNYYNVIALNTGYQNGSLVGSGTDDNAIKYEYDDPTGTWIGTDSNGNPASPVWGGQNDFINTPATILDYLENIASSIGSFFTGAIGAVTTLVTAGSAFFNTLTSLYGWLPISVLSVLSAALVIIITIGVIKVFI